MASTLGTISGKVSGFNPASVQPRANALPQESGFVRGLRDVNNRGDQQRREQESTRRYEQNRRDQAFEKIAQNPEMADQLAQQYGIQITPEMRELFKNKQATKLLVDGGKIAKDMGIQRYETAKIFVENYVKSNGDILAATAAVEGLDPRNPKKADYSHQVKLGDALVDRRTGEIIARDPGTERFYHDPRVPPDVQMQGDLIMGGKSGERTMFDFRDFNEEVSQYLSDPLPVNRGTPGQISLSQPAAPPPQFPEAEFRGYIVDEADPNNGKAVYQLPDGRTFAY